MTVREQRYLLATLDYLHRHLMTVRWTEERKATVVRAVRANVVTLERIMPLLALSAEEYTDWAARY